MLNPTDPNRDDEPTASIVRKQPLELEVSTEASRYYQVSSQHRPAAGVALTATARGARLPRVAFSLVEQFTDLRSKEVAYNFIIENQGDVPIYIDSITPRIPPEADLLEVKNQSSEIFRDQYK